MDTLVNGILKGLDYINMRDYLTRMIYQPEDIQKEFIKEKRRIKDMDDVTSSQIRNRRELLKSLNELVKVEEHETIITSKF